MLVGVLALVGGGTALASKGKGKSKSQHATLTAAVRAAHGPSDDLDAAATYLGTTTSSLLSQLQGGKTLAQIANATSGKSSSGLVAALVAHEQTEIAAAVKAGKLTQAQADRITGSLQQRFTDVVNNARPPRGGPGHFGLDLLSSAATYLGTTQPALMTQLQSGKTLAQIANATSGKSASGLIDALVAAAKAKLGANAPSDLREDITNLVNNTRPARGGPGHFGLDLLGAAATYLGTTPSALLTQLQPGKTLAQIANATSGKSVSGLIDALVAAAKAKLGTSAPSDLQQHITDAVNGMRPAGPPPGDRHGWGAPAGGTGAFGFRSGGMPTFRPAYGSSA